MVDLGPIDLKGEWKDMQKYGHNEAISWCFSMTHVWGWDLASQVSVRPLKIWGDREMSKVKVLENLQMGNKCGRPFRLHFIYLKSARWHIADELLSNKALRQLLK